MDIQVFKSYVFPIRDKLFQAAQKILQDSPEAEDVVQEVMLKLWVMRHELTGVRNIEAYVMQMNKNVCINRIRARRPASDSFDQLQAPGDTPDRHLENTDSVEMVTRIIESLPEMQQLVIRLRDIDGYQLEEIAEITGCEITAVRVNLSRARKKVKEIFFKINHFQT